MRRIGWCCFLALLVLSGCGSGKLMPKGRLLKDGKPIVLKDEEESMQIFFDPIPAEGQQHPGDMFAARYNREDGTFTVVGKDGTGMPPGKYRIAIEHHRRKSDLLKGAFAADKTPFVRDIDAKTGEIVIDLDKPTG